jgi:hypothetical protein
VLLVRVHVMTLARTVKAPQPLICSTWISPARLWVALAWKEKANRKNIKSNDLLSIGLFWKDE